MAERTRGEVDTSTRSAIRQRRSLVISSRVRRTPPLTLVAVILFAAWLPRRFELRNAVRGGERGSGRDGQSAHWGTIPAFPLRDEHVSFALEYAGVLRALSPVSWSRSYSKGTAASSTYVCWRCGVTLNGRPL